MNFNDNKEQEKILAKAFKSACDFANNASKLNPKYQKKLCESLLGTEGIRKFIEYMEKMK